MKQRMICLLLVLALACSLMPAAAAASPAVRAANALYTMGLFDGVGQHSDGSPIYALDRSLTRQEAVVLLVRLLGQEQAALTAGTAQPFADVADWAAPYVAWAWQAGLVRGVDESRLDALSPMDEQGWLTLLLRALGYDGADYDDPWTLAAQLGLCSGRSGGFTRASAVTLSLTALGLPCRGSTDTLLARLLATGAVTEQEVAQAGMTGALSRRSLTAREIAAQCAGAVFFLEVYANDGYLRSETPSATASGFFITSDGVALTNYHAVKKTMYAFATANDGSRYPVSAMLFADADRDLAVIRVDGGGRQFPCLPMRGAGAVTTGDVVYAIGSPLGLSNSISDGIVANRSRLVPQTGSPDPYIQVTAAISPGSSGGALINEYGEAIGITTATFAYGQNLNLAVPLDLALTVDLTAPGEPYESYFDAEPSPYADVAMYERYPAVPDFGAVIGAQQLAEGETEDGWFYLYALEDATEDALASYYMAMTEWGFTYAFAMDTSTMVFTAKDGSCTVYGSERTVDGETYYQIRIAEGLADTTALSPTQFPWH